MAALQHRLADQGRDQAGELLQAGDLARAAVVLTVIEGEPQAATAMRKQAKTVFQPA